MVCPINGLHNVTELYLKGKTEQCGGQAWGTTLITLIAVISYCFYIQLKLGVGACLQLSIIQKNAGNW